jgi:hypothetical protein
LPFIFSFLRDSNSCFFEQRFRDLQEEIATLEKNVTENSIENLETKKHELESLRNEKMKGKLVRSRAQWVDEGETVVLFV